MRSSKILLILSVIGFILFACEKKDDNGPLDKESSDSIFKAERDNQPWVATKTWGYYNKTNKKYTLSGAMEDSVYFQEEALNLLIDQEKIVLGEKLQDFEARLSFIIGGDGVSWRYEKTDVIEESYIIINKLDTVNKRIKGEFELKLKDAGSTEEYFMNLKKGEFDMSYEDTDS